jgi:hypothetical protein
VPSGPDDQVADLGFRTGGTCAIPASGVEAEDLAAPAGQDGVDLAVGRADDSTR